MRDKTRKTMKIIFLVLIFFLFSVSVFALSDQYAGSVDYAHTVLVSGKSLWFGKEVEGVDYFQYNPLPKIARDYALTVSEDLDDDGIVELAFLSGNDLYVYTVDSTNRKFTIKDSVAVGGSVANVNVVDTGATKYLIATLRP